MDATMQSMLADLGNLRRDVVSTAAKDVKGPSLEASRSQAAVLQQIERQKKAAIEGQRPEVAEVLNRWSDRRNFSRDEIAEGLEDRFGGQGHRLDPSHHRHHDPRREQNELRFGSERVRYLVEHGQQTPGHNLAHRATVTYSSIGAPYAFRGRTPRPQKPSNQRAPSPPAAGTVRFPPGPNRCDTPMGGHPQAVTRSASKPLKINSGLQSKRASSTSSSRSSKRPTAQAATGRRICASEIHERVRQGDVRATTCWARALWWAANPGQDCNAFLRVDADRQVYLEVAFRHLAGEVTKLVWKHAVKDIEVYVQAHKDRKWLVDAAIQARDQVTNVKAVRGDYNTDKKRDVFIELASEAYQNTQPGVVEVPPPPALVDSKITIPRSPDKVNPASDDSRDKHAHVVNSSDASSEASTDIPMTPTSAGSMVVRLTDGFGSVVGDWQIAVDVPAEVAVTVKSYNGQWDPQQLIPSLETFARALLQQKSVIPGAKLADDGLWEEDEIL